MNNTPTTRAGERTQAEEAEFQTIKGAHQGDSTWGRYQELAAKSAPKHTPNGYDPRWLAPINQALADRETGIELTDITEEIWDRFIGPMLDAIENCEVDSCDRRQSPTYLGYANGWGDVPQVRLNCKAAGHELKGVNVGRCETRYECPICNYTFKVDSSD